MRRYRFIEMPIGRQVVYVIQNRRESGIWTDCVLDGEPLVLTKVEKAERVVKWLNDPEPSLRCDRCGVQLAPGAWRHCNRGEHGPAVFSLIVGPVCPECKDTKDKLISAENDLNPQSKKETPPEHVTLFCEICHERKQAPEITMQCDQYVCGGCLGRKLNKFSENQYRCGMCLRDKPGDEMIVRNNQFFCHGCVAQVYRAMGDPPPAKTDLNEKAGCSEVESGSDRFVSALPACDLPDPARAACAAGR